MKVFEDLIQHHKIIKKLEKKLAPKRFEHTLRVAKVAYELSKVHKYHPSKAATAGLLHDCAKHYSTTKLIALSEKYNIVQSAAEKSNSDLLHSKVGAYVAKDKYHIDDPDIFNAITYHTTGRPSMSLLEKIIFISDYIEPGRHHNDRLDQIRDIAQEDLDLAMLYILEDTLIYLYQKNKTIDPLTKETYNYYKSIRKD